MLERIEEELYCVHEFLNDLNVPAQDENGNTYSTVGRIFILMKMCTPDLYPPIVLSAKDMIDQALKRIVK